MKSIAPILLVLCTLTGCATVPYTGQGPYPQISRGQPILPIDFIGNVIGIIPKVLLLNWKVANHAISAQTEQYLVHYLAWPYAHVEDTHVSLNEYNPGRDLSRLIHNHKVAWPYRLIVGLPGTLVFDVLLPGRLFGRDRYNPYTDTVQIYSDLPAIALHEAGHAHDVNRWRLKGTYATLRLLPFVDLYQEYKASDEALNFIISSFDREQELAAYKILYPAFGTYLGSYFFPPIGTVAGAAAGHVAGRGKVWAQRREFRQQDAEYPFLQTMKSRPAESTASH